MITPEMTAPYVLGLLKCVRYETKHWLDRVPVLSGAKVSIIYGFGKTTRPKNFAGILQRQNYEGENETYIEASVENSSSILYDKEIRNKPRTRRTKRNV